jgi:Ca2+-binding RTX toxin-like protein
MLLLATGGAGAEGLHGALRQFLSECWQWRAQNCIATMSGCLTHSNAAAVSGNLMPIGTNGPDNLIGAAGDDVLDGLAGDDTLNGLGGNDVLIGSLGIDRLFGGDGNDVLWADAADSVLDGGDGFDHLILLDSAAVNWNLATKNVEVVLANLGNDTLNAAGLTSSIILYGNDGNDAITLGSGGGYGFGGEGADTVIGGTGADVLLGGAGADSLDGGAGNDVLYIDAADGNAFQGGDGGDYAIVETADAVNLTLLGRGIEVVIANAGNDVIDARGTAVSMAIYGGAGDDRIYAGDGSTILEGMDGNDVLIGGAENDILFGGFGDNFLFGGGGDDLFYITSLNPGGGFSTNILYGGEYDADDWSSGIRVVIPAGGPGIDTVSVVGTAGTFVTLGYNGIDIAIGNAGADNIEAITFAGTAPAALSYLLIGNDGNDFLSGGGTGSSLYGGNGDDTLQGRSQQGGFSFGNRLYGDAGNDTILNTATNYAYGGDGNDTIHAAANSEAWGDAGDDLFDLTYGSGQSFGGSGADVFRIRSDLIPIDSHTPINGAGQINDWEDGIDRLTFVGMPDAVAGGPPAGLAIANVNGNAVLTYDASWSNLRIVYDETHGIFFEPYTVTSHYVLTILGAAGQITAADFI